MFNFQEFQEKYQAAARIAEQAHQNQKYGALPYRVHLEAVQKVLERFGYLVNPHSFDPQVAQVRVAAWLHDVLEDTVLSASNLEYHVGPEITDLVQRVTDEPGRNRKEKKLATYPKIKGNYYATVLKLADRIANVEASKQMKAEGNKNLYLMYFKEYPDFRLHLFEEQGPIKMWQYLDTLLTE
jgi:(p)ppGpp synthase/HD superfamily hydrolase